MLTYNNPEELWFWKQERNNFEDYSYTVIIALWKYVKIPQSLAEMFSTMAIWRGVSKGALWGGGIKRFGSYRTLETILRKLKLRLTTLFMCLLQGDIQFQKPWLFASKFRKLKKHFFFFDDTMHILGTTCVTKVNPPPPKKKN